ncbi:uncharacterized protein DUF2572 [Mesocricetibacter intestinalis]|uniref:Uncharacterized protein DUF2572 n=1 Tax=Mesocricetibacter intestinalis TaxID=1521930 RepID=A0A4R6VDC4_9PAST|nr:DUF2572 family protein [Mesocricetibacter intestinalis]TDQ59886.1 uncharacterized protein DUF2572 [Mesocricetibacter intestinalis]
MVNMLRRGVVNISILVFLIAFLLLMQRFTDEGISLHQGIIAQRQNYMQQQHWLLEQSMGGRHSVCKNIPTTYAANTYVVVFRSSHPEAKLKQFLICRRHRLFQRLPTKGINEGGFPLFVHLESLPFFRSQLEDAASLYENKLYWFSGSDNQWELNGNIYALVVAEGNLTLRGKGKISGAVITGGKLQRSEGIQITYHAGTIAGAEQGYRLWRLAEKSWHDFEANKL